MDPELKTILAKMSEELATIRAWVRFFGVIWVITTVLGIFMLMSSPAFRR